MRPLRILSVLSASWLLAGAARAQVNAEAIRSQMAKDGAFAALDASLVTRVGNTEGTTFGGSILGGFVKWRHLGFAKAQADYANAQGATTVSRAFIHARYNHLLTREIALEAFGQVQTDRFRRLSLRSVGGFGPRFNVVHQNHLEVFVATAYMIENEVLLASSDPQDRRHDDLFHRSSSYAGVNLVIDDRSQFTTVTYFQPRWDLPSDFRILHESALILAVGKYLSLKVGAIFRYDNEPPVGVKRYDLEVKNSLMLRF